MLVSFKLFHYIDLSSVNVTEDTLDGVGSNTNIFVDSLNFHEVYGSENNNKIL